jgi:hypothetical protein
VEAVADGLRMAEQPDEGLGEVDVVGERPQRGAVAVHDDVLAAAHALDDRPAAVEGQVHAVVRVRGAHDRRREALPAVRADQELLAGDLVLRVGPDRVAQGRRLDDRQAAHGLLVGRGRADEDELAGAPGEEVDVELDVLGREGDEVDDGVELAVADRRSRGRRVADVAVQPVRPGGQRSRRRAPAVEDVQLDAQLDRALCAGRADLPRAPDEQDLQGGHRPGS